jgi:hypothetical protein
MATLLGKHPPDGNSAYEDEGTQSHTRPNKDLVSAAEYKLPQTSDKRQKAKHHEDSKQAEDQHLLLLRPCESCSSCCRTVKNVYGPYRDRTHDTHQEQPAKNQNSSTDTDGTTRLQASSALWALRLRCFGLVATLET